MEIYGMAVGVCRLSGLLWQRILQPYSSCAS